MSTDIKVLGWESAITQETPQPGQAYELDPRFGAALYPLSYCILKTGGSPAGARQSLQKLLEMEIPPEERGRAEPLLQLITAQKTRG